MFETPLLSPLPPWPAGVPRIWQPIGRLTGLPPLAPRRRADAIAEAHARRLGEQAAAIRNGGLTQTYSEVFFSNRSDYSAFNTSSAEGSLLAGVNEQPVIPALTWDGNKAFGKVISFLARGVLGTTSTPTIIFQWRLGTTSGSTFLSGTSVGVSAAITTSSGVSNKWWESRLDLICNTPGIGTGNTTLSGSGYVMSPGGFASPFIYALEPTTPDTATWTSTIDASVTQYANLSVTWSASSASNTCTLKQLVGSCLN